MFTLVRNKQKDTDRIKRIVPQEAQIGTVFTVLKEDKIPIYHKISHIHGVKKVGQIVTPNKVQKR